VAPFLPERCLSALARQTVVDAGFGAHLTSVQRNGARGKASRLAAMHPLKKPARSGAEVSTQQDRPAEESQ